MKAEKYLTKNGYFSTALSQNGIGIDINILYNLSQAQYRIVEIATVIRFALELLCFVRAEN